MASATVSTPYLRILVEGAKAAYVNVDDLPRDVFTAIEQPDGRIDREAHNLLWERIAARSGDRVFGLHLAERLSPGAFAVLDYVTRNAPTLGEAFGCVVRYSRLIHDAAEVRLDIDDRDARLSYCLPTFPDGSPRHAAEFIVGCWIVVGRQLIAKTFNPQEVHFQHGAPPPEALREHQRILGCAPAFDRERNEIVFDAALLDEPVLEADPALSALLSRMADEMLRKLPNAGDEDFVGKVRRLVAEALKEGDPSLEPIAKRLHMSPRTLQRRLKEEGASHQELLDALRRTLARKYLGEPSIAIGETAFLLGFSEPSAFHRAFKRWTGQTPGAFRRQRLMH